MRTVLNSALKKATEECDQRAVHTIRLILAAVSDRDACERNRGNSDGIEEGEIVSMMEAMVRQRHDAIARYEESGRLEEADQEREEIDIISEFLPRKMNEDQMKAIVDRVIEHVNPTGIREIPKVMAQLREQYPGQMDFNSACKVVRARLT